MAGSGRRTHYRKHLTDAVLNDLPEPDEGLGRRVALVVGTRGGNMFDVVVAPPSASTAAVDEDDALRSSSSSEEGGGDEGGGIPPETMTACDDGDDGGKIDERRPTTGRRHHHPPVGTVRRSSPQLAFLPAKFRKLIWIKRNDFVIVECGDEEEDEGGRKITIRQGKSEEGEPPPPSSSSGGGGGGGFRYVITNILYKDQVKHIKSRGMWPSDPLFAEDAVDDHRPTRAVSGGTGGVRSDHRVAQTEGTDNDDCHPDDDDYDYDYDDCDSPSDDRDGAYEEGGIVFDDPLGRDELALNTNRLAALRVIADSSSSEEEDSD
jgi:hypothetical protein